MTILAFQNVRKGEFDKMWLKLLRQLRCGVALNPGGKACWLPAYHGLKGRSLVNQSFCSLRAKWDSRIHARTSFLHQDEFHRIVHQSVRTTLNTDLSNAIRAFNLTGLIFLWVVFGTVCMEADILRCQYRRPRPHIPTGHYHLTYHRFCSLHHLFDQKRIIIQEIERTSFDHWAHCNIEVIIGDNKREGGAVEICRKLGVCFAHASLPAEDDILARSSAISLLRRNNLGKRRVQCSESCEVSSWMISRGKDGISWCREVLKRLL